MSKRKNTGFTLLELVIVIAIIGVLVVIAYPAYQDYIRKSRRSEAMVALTAIAQLQETFYTKRNRYSTALTVADGADSLNCDQKGLCTATGATVSGHYQLGITFGATGNIATSFVLTAAATTVDNQTKDTRCNSFSIDNTGQKTAKNSGGTDNSAECWKK